MIKSILFSIQVLWAQIFVLPKKVVKIIEATCKTFLWTGGAELSRKTLMAWYKICQPGGLNILDIGAWNKATMIKLLWSLSHKKDKLWVKWTHYYYGKKRDLFVDIPKQASWIVQKASKYLVNAGRNMNDLYNFKTILNQASLSHDQR